VKQLKNYTLAFLPKLFSAGVSRFFLSFAVFALVSLHSLNILPINFITNLENRLYDFRLTATWKNEWDKKVVIADVDEKSIRELGRWPWHRNTIADLVNKLFDEHEIRVLGFDMVFAEKDDLSANTMIDDLLNYPEFQTESIKQKLDAKRAEWETDLQLAESMIARDLVMGIVFKKPPLSDGENAENNILPFPLLTEKQIENIDLPFYSPVGYTANIEELQTAALTAAFFDYPREEEVLRKVPMVQKYKGNIYPSLSLEVSRIYVGAPSLQFNFIDSPAKTKTEELLLSINIGKYNIPVDETVSSYVPYKGYQGVFRYLPIADILMGRLADDDKVLLKDSIVLVGTSAPGLLDLRATPFDESYIGVEVHANMISGILEQRIKKVPSYVTIAEVLQLLIISTFLLLLLPRVSPVSIVLVLFMTVSLAVSLNAYLWQFENIVFPIASSLVLIGLASFIHILYDYFIESRNRRRLSGFFGQYVPPELVEEMDGNSAELSLAGENKNMSVLFSDVRSFTTISEGLDPESLTQLMNDFLTPITKIIHQNRGTIDKYMGDAVMAFWGAPVTDEEHAQHSIDAAFEMIAAMDSISADFRSRGLPEIKVGVGVNSGEMNVGNMGSEFRMAYTVLGDAVNLGSRLEGLTKAYGVDIIVGQETVELARSTCYRELDKVKVKGKLKPVTIFEPIPPEQAELKSVIKELDQYHIALRFYLKREWDQAESLFARLASKQNKRIYDIYLERICHNREFDPGPDWDGSFTHTTK